MNCETAKQHLLLMTYAELSFDEEEQLEQHLLECASCQAERARLEHFEDILAAGESEVPTGLLARCRRDLAESVVQERLPVSRFSPGRIWREWFINMPVWLRLSATAALAVVCFASGYLSPRTAVLDNMATRAGIAEPAPVFSRVRFVNPDASGRVRVMFEETRQRETTGHIDDENIRRMLLSAASDPSDPGLRVETMDLLKSQCENDQVRRALLHALRSDNNSGVRLKALEGLKAYASDDEVRKVIAQAVLADDNPGVRTNAIDVLIQSKQPEIVGVLQDVLRNNEDNSYVRSRSLRALSEMKASQGTF